MRLWTQLAALLRKEFAQTIRDRRIMVLIVFVPLVQVIVFGFAVDLEVDRIPIGIVDQDHSVESRLWTRRLLSDGTLVLAAASPSVDEVSSWLVRGDAKAVAIFPPRFGRSMARGGAAEVQILLDGSDPNRTTVAQKFIFGLFQPIGDPVRTRNLFNPGLDTPPFMLPGVAGILLLLVTTVISAMGLARERESGTLEQLRVTPIPAAVLLAGKVLPFAVVGAIDFVLAMGAAHLFFGMPLRGLLLELALIAGLYVVCTLATGLAIATFSRTQQQAFLGGFVFLLPAALLSGAFTPVASMPAWLQALTWANPLRHFAELVRLNVFTGRSPLDAPANLAALGLYALVISAVAVIRFSRVRD